MVVNTKRKYGGYRKTRKMRGGSGTELAPVKGKAREVQKKRKQKSKKRGRDEAGPAEESGGVKKQERPLMGRSFSQPPPDRPSKVRRVVRQSSSAQDFVSMQMDAQPIDKDQVKRILTHFAKTTLVKASEGTPEEKALRIKQILRDNKEEELIYVARLNILSTKGPTVVKLLKDINSLKKKAKKDGYMACVLEKAGDVGERLEGIFALHAFTKYLVQSGAGQLLVTGVQELINVVVCLIRHTCSTLVNIPGTLGAIRPIIQTAFGSLNSQLQGALSVLVLLLLIKGMPQLINKTRTEVEELLGKVRYVGSAGGKVITITLPEVFMRQLGMVGKAAGTIAGDNMMEFTANIAQLGDNAIVGIGKMLRTAGVPTLAGAMGAAGDAYYSDIALAEDCIDNAIKRLESFFINVIFPNLEMNDMQKIIIFLKEKLKDYTGIEELDDNVKSNIDLLLGMLTPPLPDEGGAPADAPGGGGKKTRKRRKSKRKSKKKKSRGGYKHKKTRSKKQRRRRN